jgi:hypothetical protein
MSFDYRPRETYRNPLYKDARHTNDYRFVSWRQEHQ